MIQVSATTSKLIKQPVASALSGASLQVPFGFLATQRSAKTFLGLSKSPALLQSKNRSYRRNNCNQPDLLLRTVDTKMHHSPRKPCWPNLQLALLWPVT